MTSVVEIRDASKVYRRGPEEVHALEHVTLAIASGEIVALVGPSGSGKTTLLNVLAGWEHLDRGEILWPASSSIGSPAELPWSELAILPQSVGLIEELSVRENVSLPGRFGHAMDEDRVDLLLKNLGLGGYAHRAPAEISIGEQQRTGLARALALSPRLLLADEPTGHQDAVWAKGVFKVLRRAAQEGTACLVATHNRELLQYADRIVGIRDGRLEDVAHDAAKEQVAVRRRSVGGDELPPGSQSERQPERQPERKKEWPTGQPAADDRGLWGPR